MLIFDFSAEFGGRDAMEACLPHLKALKEAAKQIELTKFPFGEIHFILRIDGEIKSYDGTLVGPVTIDTSDRVVSVDLEVSLKDRQELARALSELLASSVRKIAVEVPGVDETTLADDIDALIRVYKAQLPHSARTS